MRFVKSDFNFPQRIQKFILTSQMSERIKAPSIYPINDEAYLKYCLLLLFEFLKETKRIPQDCLLVACGIEIYRNAVYLICEDESFKEVLEGAECPVIEIK